MKGQKQAVVEAVLNILPNFAVGKDVALSKLTVAQLEIIKASIGLGISSGAIEYTKDRSNSKEVISYARSMVMNHMKKAKELNGGLKYTTGTVAVVNKQQNTSAINTDILPGYLKDFVTSLSE